MQGFRKQVSLFFCHRAPLAAGVVALILFSSGCGAPPSHPGQINVLDGSTYDSLTVAHTALATLRPDIVAKYPIYVAEFNAAAASYNTAFQSYVVFRTAPTTNQAQLTMEIANLTVSVVGIENAFSVGMHATPSVVLSTRNKGHHLQARAQANGISISDILTELEIAASIAATIPATQPYSTIAQLVLEATQKAIAAHTANQSQPIDLQTIQPISAIPVAVS
jgi:hypothetical protein